MHTYLSTIDVKMLLKILNALEKLNGLLIGYVKPIVSVNRIYRVNMLNLIKI